MNNCDVCADNYTQTALHYSEEDVLLLFIPLMQYHTHQILTSAHAICETLHHGRVNTGCIHASGI